MKTLFSLPPVKVLRIQSMEEGFPVHRVFCIGRNYADHAKEMGAVADTTTPFYFLKSARHVLTQETKMTFPLGTEELHHEVELVAVLDKPAFRVTEAQAKECIYGYAVGLDLTRRDLQTIAKAKGLPWDGGKDFEDAAVVGEVTPKALVPTIEQASICLWVNGEEKQRGNCQQMIFSVPALIAYLSQFYHLQAGDILFTGTPKGVGALQVGDVLVGEIEGLRPLHLSLVSA